MKNSVNVKIAMVKLSPYGESGVRGIRYTQKIIICRLRVMTVKHKTFVLVFTGMTSVYLAEYRKVIERRWEREDSKRNPVTGPGGPIGLVEV
jgi:hypothetical protein